MLGLRTEVRRSSFGEGSADHDVPNARAAGRVPAAGHPAPTQEHDPPTFSGLRTHDDTPGSIAAAHGIERGIEVDKADVLRDQPAQRQAARHDIRCDHREVAGRDSRPVVGTEQPLRPVLHEAVHVDLARAPCGVIPTSVTVPPGRAGPRPPPRSTPGRCTRLAWSAPPSVSRVASLSAPGSRAYAAPRAVANESLSGSRSIAITVAPVSTAAINAASPTPPRPITTTVSPALTPAVARTAPTPVVAAQPMSAATSCGVRGSTGMAAAAATTCPVACVPTPL